MAKETAELADYAASCRYEDIPPDVVERAKQCITDTIAAVIFGYDLPWSRMVVAFAAKNGAGGNSRILGPGAPRVHAPAAALANGALAHAFEMDNLTWPSTGVHPGATLLTSGLAVAQERGIGGRALITATVAGAEVMIRIGRATKHSNESRGFHAPGTTGPFGEGSLQIFIESVNSGEILLDDLRRLALLDLILNNADRKGEHCLIGDNEKLWGIDHGLTFHPQPKLRTVLWHFAGSPIPEEDSRGLQTFLGALRGLAGDQVCELRELISAPEWRALVTRVDRLASARTFPDPRYKPVPYRW